MKLTFIFSHKDRVVERSLNVRKWISLLVLTTLFVIVSSRSTQSVDENVQRVQLVKQGLLAQQEIVFALQAQNEIETSALIRQLAKLENKLSKLGKKKKIGKREGKKVPFPWFSLFFWV